MKIKQIYVQKGAKTLPFYNSQKVYKYDYKNIPGAIKLEKNILTNKYTSDILSMILNFGSKSFRTLIYKKNNTPGSVYRKEEENAYN